MGPAASEPPVTYRMRQCTATTADDSVSLRWDEYVTREKPAALETALEREQGGVIFGCVLWDGCTRSKATNRCHVRLLCWQFCCSWIWIGCFPNVVVVVAREADAALQLCPAIGEELLKS